MGTTRPQRRLPGPGPLFNYGGGGTRHGLLEAEAEALFARQGHRCAVCRSTSPGAGGSRWAVDHDHRLAETHGHDPLVGCRRCVRAILCNGCNIMLGGAGDVPAVLRAGADYLDRWRAQVARA